MPRWNSSCKFCWTFLRSMTKVFKQGLVRSKVPEQLLPGHLSPLPFAKKFFACKLSEVGLQTSTVFVSVGEGVWVCLLFYVYVCLCVCMPQWVCLCLVCVCVWCVWCVCVCVCVYVCVCVWVFNFKVGYWTDSVARRTEFEDASRTWKV